MFVPPARATEGASPTARWFFFRPNRAGVCVWRDDSSRGWLADRRALSFGPGTGVGGWASRSVATFHVAWFVPVLPVGWRSSSGGWRLGANF